MEAVSHHPDQLACNTLAVMLSNACGYSLPTSSTSLDRTGILPVSLIQNEPADGAEGDAQCVPDVVDQTTRSGDQDVDAFT